MKRGADRWALLAVVAALAGCAAVTQRLSGDVSLAALEPPDAERHTMADDEDFRMGTPIFDDARAMPVYPSEWLTRAPAQVVACVELTIDERGEVESSRPLLEAPGCGALPGAMADAFHRSVADAVRSWRYTPSLLCRLHPDAVADGRCEDPLAREAVAVLRGYRFVFARTAAGAEVGVSETTGH